MVERKSSARPCANFAENVGGGGRDQQQIVLLRDADMLDGAGKRGFGTGGGEQVGDDLAAGERGEGEGPDELFGGARQHHLDFVAVLDQRAGEFGGFICRDPAAHPENDAHFVSDSDAFRTVRFERNVFHHDGFALDFVLHQTAARFFHGDDGRLLRGGGQHGRWPPCSCRARLAATMMNR